MDSYQHGSEMPGGQSPSLGCADTTAASAHSPLAYPSPRFVSPLPPAAGVVPMNGQHAPTLPSVSEYAKRCRDEDDDWGRSYPQAAQLLPSVDGGASISLKKARDSQYKAPTAIPKTFTSAAGTLSPPTAINGPVVEDSNRRVAFRRQLSGSKVEFLLQRTDDGMDVDEPLSSRARSMSF